MPQSARSHDELGAARFVIVRVPGDLDVRPSRACGGVPSPYRPPPNRSSCRIPPRGAPDAPPPRCEFHSCSACRRCSDMPAPGSTAAQRRQCADFDRARCQAVKAPPDPTAKDQDIETFRLLRHASSPSAGFVAFVAVKVGRPNRNAAALAPLLRSMCSRANAFLARLIATPPRSCETVAEAPSKPDDLVGDLLGGCGRIDRQWVFTPGSGSSSVSIWRCSNAEGMKWPWRPAKCSAIKFRPPRRLRPAAPRAGRR